MGLTNKNVLLLAVLLAAALFAVTVWLWPRLAGRGVVPVLGRVGMLLGTQLALIGALGLAVNNAFGFYASWADLLGRNTTPGLVVDHVAADGGGTAGSRLRFIGSQGVDVPGGGVPRLGGRIEEVVVGGGSSGISAPAYVYLPPQYFQQPHRLFPAAVVLTGYPGTAASLITKLRYPTTAATEVHDGRAQPMVLVMMRPTVVPPRDTECMDVPHGPQVETFFTRDVPAALTARFRIGTGAGSWGAIGDSTGGYCALKFAMQHPHAYSAAAALSTNYATPEDATTGDLFGGSPAVKRANDLIWRLSHLPRPPVSLLVTSSRHGEHNYQATMRFIHLVKGPTRIASIILPSGGHNFTTWEREIPPALIWLSSHLYAVAPAHTGGHPGGRPGGTVAPALPAGQVGASRITAGRITAGGPGTGR